jgi:Uma2 family endonuclease
MSMPASSRRWTLDEVRAMQDEERPWPRYELIEGELLVTPAPRPVHQRAVLRLARVLAEYVEPNALGEVWTSPADIELESGTIVQPDVFVVPRSPALPVASWRDLDTLTLAAEVSSPSTARWDRVTKRRFFGRRRVDQYWVIDLDARVVERTVPGDPKVEVLDAVLEWHPAGVASPFRLDLPPFFARVQGDA